MRGRKRKQREGWMVSPLSVSRQRCFLGELWWAYSPFRSVSLRQKRMSWKSPPSLRTVHGSGSKLRRWLRIRQKHHTFFLIPSSFGFASPPRLGTCNCINVWLGLAITKTTSVYKVSFFWEGGRMEFVQYSCSFSIHAQTQNRGRFCFRR